MTCNDCEEIQHQNAQGKNVAFLRINEANVLIGACDRHFNIVQSRMGLGENRPVVRIKDVNAL